MQEQSLSAVSFIQFLEDAHLNHLFQTLQDNQDVTINAINMDCQPGDTIHQNVTINPEEIQKGYGSDDGHLKKSKNKRIKKKKPMFIQREEENKKRRIKIYIESLQSRITELQAENQKLKKINQLNIGYIRKLNDSEHIINGFFIDRQKLFARIEKLLQCDNPDISKIQIQCQTLKRRQGALGNERIKAVNYYFKQLLHMILPNIQKYITEAAYNSTDIFSPTYRNNFVESQNEDEKLSFIKQISPSDEIIQKLLEKKSDLINLKIKFNQKAVEMYNNKCDLITITRQIEKICELYGERVASFKKAQFLCYAQKHKQDEDTFAPNLKTMYQQLEKCNRFSYNYQYQQRKNARPAKIF